MCGITQSRRSMATDHPSDDVRSVRRQARDEERLRLYRRAILIAIVGNVVLAGAKGLVASVSGSSAVLSDAVNSLSDTLYSLLMALGLTVAHQPADRGHPQGHTRFEPFVSLLIAAVMGLAGYAAIREAVQRFQAGGAAIPLGWPIVALVGSAGVKVVMYKLVLDAGQKAESPAIRASARDNLADVLASLAALVGVVASNVVHPLADPLAGFVVVLWMVRAIWEIVAENLGYLTGRGAPPELTEQIVRTASTVPGVVNVHQVIADHVGPEVRVDMHIDVDGQITLREAHAIGDEVEERVEALPGVGRVFVHVEPDRG